MQNHNLNVDDINNNINNNNNNGRNYNANEYIINDVDNVCVDDSNIFDTNYVYETINRRNSGFNSKNTNNTTSNYKLYFDDEYNNDKCQNVRSKSIQNNNESVSTLNFISKRNSDIAIFSRKILK